ncbi:hypothetical protein MSAN_02161100 [Mycena sanguinolenta]|uniref:Transmembrane protein 135 N-terminal domain-containing protein n=1 Tax=Mycena sanguinolenta TaxID=230812 RepID=A0A8H6XDQ9_9AGAR|nr:hypothetical protein MSAN_02161100 [Mycena sanguinolenta]
MHPPPRQPDLSPMSLTARWLHRVNSLIPANSSHPLQVAVRTYCLSLLLSLGPSLVPFLTARRSHKTSIHALKRVLVREFGPKGFAFSVTLALGGGSFIREFWRILDDLDDSDSAPDGGSAKAAALKLRALISALKLTSAQKTFLSNVVSSSLGLLLLQAGRAQSSSRSTLHSNGKEPGASRTLDLTLLLLVRALDAAVQSFVARKSGSRRESDADLPEGQRQSAAERLVSGLRREALRTQIDSFVFWACSARIMWCFFYEPQRLPKSYVKWINTLAGVDPRLLEALRLIRTKQWSYRSGSPSHLGLLRTYALDLGHPATWGDPTSLPAFGGSEANQVWKQLGMTGRRGVGGLPCQMVHGEVGSSLGLEQSCTANAGLRGIKAFLEAVAIYLPVQFAPVILSRPRALLDPRSLLLAILGALRIVLARLLPFVSHDFWDGPFGGVLAGCLVCGSSIWIENGRRRGEMSLYVLPRAVRACLPDRWVRSGNTGVRLAERITFVVSLSALLTAASHHPHTLRGLSRWGLRFIVKGPNVAFWKNNDNPKQISSEKQLTDKTQPEPV